MTTKNPLFGEKVESLAFGSIQASRISGQRELYGSDISTGGWVSIRIYNAVHYDDAYADHSFSGGKQLMEVSLSEAQWVSFVSRMNLGSGTQCTLDYRPAPDAPMINPQLPKIEKASERMDRRVQQIREAKNQQLKDRAAALLDAAGKRMPKKEFEDFRRGMDTLVNNLYADLEFGAQILTQHKEEMVKNALVEIDAALKGYVHLVGLDTLKLAMNGTPPVDSKALDGPET